MILSKSILLLLFFPFGLENNYKFQEADHYRIDASINWSEFQFTIKDQYIIIIEDSSNVTFEVGSESKTHEIYDVSTDEGITYYNGKDKDQYVNWAFYPTGEVRLYYNFNSERKGFDQMIIFR